MDKKAIKIFYFTGTGNSLKIAKDVGSKLGTHELIFIPEI
jgi:flavodoxin